jgi:prephenate dehydrogenase
MIKEDFQYYLDNQTELVSEYCNRYIVIKDKKVVGNYGTEKEAYIESTKEYELGTFLIQHCMPGTENYTQTFHSRWIFV